MGFYGGECCSLLYSQDECSDAALAEVTAGSVGFWQIVANQKIR